MTICNWGCGTTEIRLLKKANLNLKYCSSFTLRLQFESRWEVRRWCVTTEQLHSNGQCKGTNLKFTCRCWAPPPCCILFISELPVCEYTNVGVLWMIETSIHEFSFVAAFLHSLFYYCWQQLLLRSFKFNIEYTFNNIFPIINLLTKKKYFIPVKSKWRFRKYFLPKLFSALWQFLRFFLISLLFYSINPSVVSEIVQSFLRGGRGDNACCSRKNHLNNFATSWCTCLLTLVNGKQRIRSHTSWLNFSFFSLFTLVLVTL